MRAERILFRWVTNFFLEILGELLENFSPNITKYSIKNWSYWNLGESRNSGSHQFRPHCVVMIWDYKKHPHPIDRVKRQIFECNHTKAIISVAKSWTAKFPPSLLKIPHFCPPLNAENPTILGQKIPHFEVKFLKFWPLLLFLLHFYA